MGSPTPTALWYKDGEVIRDNMGYQQTVEGQFHKLILKEAFVEDSGTYKVVALNAAGKAESSCKLKVKHREQLEDRSIGKPPKIIQPLVDKVVSERDQIYLEIRVDSTTFVTFKWYVLPTNGVPECQIEQALRDLQCPNLSFFRLKDGKDISEMDARYNVKTIGKISYLVVNNSKPMDSSRYSCTVQNISGIVQTSALVTVQGKFLMSENSLSMFDINRKLR